MDQWRAAAVALEEERGRRLASISDREALAATNTVLDLAGTIPLPETRRMSSGLVTQQALFHGHLDS